MEEETQGGCLDPLVTSALGITGCVTLLVVIFVAVLLVLVVGAGV